MQQKADPDTRFNLAPSASLTRVLPMPLVNPTFSFHNHLPVGGALTRSLDVFAMCSAERGRGGNALAARQIKSYRSSFSPFGMHRSSPMRKQTTLSSFLLSEKTPDAGKHSKTSAEKDDQMILKGSNVADDDRNLIVIEITRSEIRSSEHLGPESPPDPTAGSTSAWVDTDASGRCAVRCCL